VRPGDAVAVTDPARPPLFDPFVGVVVYLNGDLIDVLHPLGGIEPYPPEWCTLTEPSWSMAESRQEQAHGR